MGERRAQKSRTREALLAAARRLIERGAPVTVPATAAEAGISKATAYRYFSDASVLAAEAGLALAARPYEEIVAEAVGARARTRAVALHFFDLALAHEAAFRRFLARSLDAWSADYGAPPRGARRPEMFRRALAGERVRLGEARLERLVAALTAASGAEAMIALRDVAGTTPEAGRAAVAETVEALLDRHLGPGPP